MVVVRVLAVASSNTNMMEVQHSSGDDLVGKAAVEAVGHSPSCPS